MNRRRIIAAAYAAGIAWCVGCAVAVRRIEHHILVAAGNAANESDPYA